MHFPDIIDVIGKTISPMDCQGMLKLCYQQAKLFSHDPNTRNGAIVVNTKGLIIGVGANRMAHNSLCTDENLQAPRKYQLIEHAERDAIYSAARWTDEKLDGCMMFCPFACCPLCANAIGLGGITHLVIHKQCIDRMPERWQEPVATGHDILRRMGVEISVWSGEVGTFDNLFDGKVWRP